MRLVDLDGALERGRPRLFGDEQDGRGDGDYEPILSAHVHLSATAVRDRVLDVAKLLPIDQVSERTGIAMSALRGSRFLLGGEPETTGD